MFLALQATFGCPNSIPMNLPRCVTAELQASSPGHAGQAPRRNGDRVAINDNPPGETSWTHDFRGLAVAACTNCDYPRATSGQDGPETINPENDQHAHPGTR